MKKTYISPEVIETILAGSKMIATSVIGLSGDSGLGMGEGDAPGEADAREQREEWDIWANPEEELLEEENGFYY